MARRLTRMLGIPDEQLNLNYLDEHATAVTMEEMVKTELTQETGFYHLSH